MSKTSGLGDNFYIGGFDLSGDVGSVDTLSGGPALLDVTGIKKSANERIGALRSADWQFTSFFNAASGAEHPALSGLPRTDVVATYFRGTTLGDPAAGITAKQIDYDPTRGADGSLTLKTELQSNGFGYDWGVMLTAGLRTDTTGTTGAAFDQGAGGSHGAQAYLELVEFTGTSVDVKIEHCTTTGGSYTSLIDFGSQTAVGGFRGSVTGTVDEFLKVVTSGTFSNAVFAVVFALNATAVTF